MVKYLLEAGADPNIESLPGATVRVGLPCWQSGRGEAFQSLGAHDLIPVNESTLGWLAELPTDTPEATESAKAIASTMLDKGAYPVYSDVLACIEKRNHVLMEMFLDHSELDVELSSKNSASPSQGETRTSFGLLLAAITAFDHAAVQALQPWHGC